MVDDKTILKMCKNRLKPSIYDKFLAILENLTSCQLTSNDDLAASKSSCCGEQTTSRAIKKTINLANRPVTIQSYPCKDNEIVIRVYDCNNTNTNIEDALYQFDLNYNPNTDIIIIDEPLEFVEVPRETLKKNSDFVQDLKASKRRKLEGEIPKYKIKCVSRDPANLQNSHKKPVTPNKDSSNVDKNYLKRPKPQESVKQNLCVAEVTSLTNNKNAYQNLLEMAMVKDKPLNKPKSNKKITLKTTSKANVRSPMPGKSVSGKLSGKKAHQTNINKLGHNQQTSTAVSNADDDVVICLYSCEICFKAFETFNEMQEHFNKSLCASKLRIFQCNNCSNNIFGFYNFMKHLMECENIDPYKSQL
uniref:Uncharacterized protein n=1 Tax=Stomoxys calcitrans TaxID=35570 RepID=A0A1I8Q840_STOCA